MNILLRCFTFWTVLSVELDACGLNSFEALSLIRSSRLTALPLGLRQLSKLPPGISNPASLEGREVRCVQIENYVVVYQLDSSWVFFLDRLRRLEIWDTLSSKNPGQWLEPVISHLENYRLTSEETMRGVYGREAFGLRDRQAIELIQQPSVPIQRIRISAFAEYAMQCRRSMPQGFSLEVQRVVLGRIISVLQTEKPPVAIRSIEITEPPLSDGWVEAKLVLLHGKRRVFRLPVNASGSEPFVGSVRETQTDNK